MYSIAQIKSILKISTVKGDESIHIESYAFDSRKIVDGRGIMFLCLQGSNRDGHDYLEEAYKRGIRVALVSRKSLPPLKGMQYIVVPNVLVALQQLAANHRSSFADLTVLGITGSNAKTIIKEWLFQLIHSELEVVRSPKSYNSQIGVALSLLQIEEKHRVGIIEAGISITGEMDAIQTMIQPDIGIFSNIGEAHAGGFTSIEEKIEEKSILFRNCNRIIVSSDHPYVYNHLISVYGKKNVISWGHGDSDKYKISDTEGELFLSIGSERLKIGSGSSGHYYIENLIHTIVAGVELGIDTHVIKKKMSLLTSLDMRLEHIQGRNGSIIVNDAYVADLTSLKVAFQHISNLNHKGPSSLIISDIHGLKPEDGDYEVISEMINQLSLTRLITIGSDSEVIHVECAHFHFPSTIEILERIETFNWDNHLILIKGSRQFQLDALVSKLEKSSHSAQLEINIPALHHNITQIKNILPSDTGLIPVLKASAYGAGIEKIAEAVASHQPSFIAVAYTDEGIRLRQHGINDRIIILNPDPGKGDLLFNYDLEPEVHNLEMLHNYASKAAQLMTTLNVHLKLDSGMHRLGFLEEDIESLIESIQNLSQIRIATIFSHLSASDEKGNDSYTRWQVDRFRLWAEKIIQILPYQPELHILNSEGIWRFPEYSFDHVRAGITLYGISKVNQSLKKVHALYARIMSIKKYKFGTEIGYGRSQTLESDSTIAVINIGYADGLMRSGSNGKISVRIRGVLCPVVGRICMDVTMVDVSSCPEARPGDIVEIFGHHISIEKLAQQLGTIPYEVLCGISGRIVRKYIVD